MRVGRFVVLRDIDGRTHAVAAGAVAAICETDDGALLMLPGGKLVHVPRPLEVVLAWLDGRNDFNAQACSLSTYCGGKRGRNTI
jgi:hypothetical protein